MWSQVHAGRADLMLLVTLCVQASEGRANVSKPLISPGKRKAGKQNELAIMVPKGLHKPKAFCLRDSHSVYMYIYIYICVRIIYIYICTHICVDGRAYTHIRTHTYMYVFKLLHLVPSNVGGSGCHSEG